MERKHAGATRGDSAAAQAAADRVAAIRVELWLAKLADAGGSDAFKRRVLARYCALQPQQLRFDSGEHGKPVLLEPPIPLDFNLSHSGDLILCAVSNGAPLGVDLEHGARERDTLKLARRFFAANEVALLESLPQARQSALFYDLWTLKESAVKARGGALAPGLRNWAFRIDEPARAADCADIQRLHHDDHPDARYFLFDIGQGYRASLCMLCDSTAAVELNWFDGFGVPTDAPRLRAQTFY